MVGAFDSDGDRQGLGGGAWRGAARSGGVRSGGELTGDPEVGLGAALGWRIAGTMFVTGAVVAAILGLAGVYHAASGRLTDTLATLVAVPVGALFYVAGPRARDARWLHAVPIAALGGLAAWLSDMGSAAPRLVLGYAVVLVWVAMFMSRRALAAYSAVVVGLFVLTYFQHNDDPTAGIPILTTMISLIAILVVTSLARDQLDRVAEQAAALSGRDALTGLWNLRPFYDRVEMLVQRAERGAGSFSVVMLDLDSFREINDHYSRTTGDQTLQAVGIALEGVVREDELVARRGGDEFAILTDAHESDDVSTLVERLAGQVATARMAICPDAPGGLTAGVATWHDGDSGARLLARADHALKEAKLRARNNWVTDEDVQP